MGAGIQSHAHSCGANTLTHWYIFNPQIYYFLAIPTGLSQCFVMPEGIWGVWMYLLALIGNLSSAGDFYYKLKEVLRDFSV